MNYPAFQNTITVVILINITMLATESYDMKEWSMPETRNPEPETQNP